MSNNVASKIDQVMTLGKVTVALKLLSTDAPRVFCHLIQNTLALRTGWSWQCCLEISKRHSG